MGKFSRDKGMRFEREIVDALRSAGIDAQRVPLSGAVGGQFGGDITATIAGKRWRIELKKRANGFKSLYDWLRGNDAVVVASDRNRPLVVLPLDVFLRLVA